MGIIVENNNITNIVINYETNENTKNITVVSFTISHSICTKSVAY